MNGRPLPERRSQARASKIILFPQCGENEPYVTGVCCLGAQAKRHLLRERGSVQINMEAP